MAINYVPQKISDNIKKDDKAKNKYFPRCLSREVINEERLAHEIASTSGYSEAEARAAVDIVFTTITQVLGDGHFINIERFGHFHPTAKYKDGIEANENTRAQNVEVKGVAFIPSPKLKRELNIAGFQRADTYLLQQKESERIRREKYKKTK